MAVDSLRCGHPVCDGYVVGGGLYLLVVQISKVVVVVRG